MDIIEKKLQEIGSQIADELNVMLLEVRLFRRRKGTTITFVIDDDDGIDANDCAKFSRRVMPEIEKIEELNDYRVEVSSPGVDRPLKFLRQYPKHKNREFELKYLENESEQNISAKLIDVEGNKLIFQAKGKKLEIDFEKILKAKVKISF